MGRDPEKQYHLDEEKMIHKLIQGENEAIQNRADYLSPKGQVPTKNNLLITGKEQNNFRTQLIAFPSSSYQVHLANF